MKVIFFGSSAYVLPIIQILHDHFDLTLVVTTEKNNTDPVPTLCKQLGTDILTTNTLVPDEIEMKLRNENADVAIVASFGLIIPEEILHIFPKGIVNIHPSYLPYYRGSTPIQTALANGDTETAVSIMVIDTKMDHGPLLSQLPLAITPEDTTQSLYEKAFQMGAEKLVDILPAYVEGTIEPREQDHSKATFTPKEFTRESGFFEITNPPANLSHLIRAYYPWPGVWTKIRINDQEKVLKLLPNNMFQVEGKNPVNKKDLLNGYPQLKEVLTKLN